MKTLLSLSIALLSLNLYGEEKTPNEIRLEAEIVNLKKALIKLQPIEPSNFTRTGLEGWGKGDGRRFEGVLVVVEDYSDLDKTFDKKAIKNQVELKLRLAGIKISQRFPDDYIHIDMMPTRAGGRLIGYGITVIPQRMMTFKYNGKEYMAFNSSNHSYGGNTPPNHRPELNKHLDQLLLDYLKANPITPKDQ